MHLNEPRSSSEFIDQLNSEPHASFSELANKIDLWASRSGQTRAQVIAAICQATGRESVEQTDSRPISSTEFIEFPVVIFAVKGDA